MQRQQDALCDPGKQSRAENHRGEALSQALLGQQSFPKEGDGQVKMWRMEGPWEECLGQRQWLGRRVNLARLENLEWMSGARMLCLRYGSGWGGGPTQGAAGPPRALTTTLKGIFYLCVISKHQGLVWKVEQPGGDILACGQLRDKN